MRELRQRDERLGGGLGEELEGGRDEREEGFDGVGGGQGGAGPGEGGGEGGECAGLVGEMCGEGVVGGFEAVGREGY